MNAQAQHILIVDDDPEISSLLSGYLGGHGLLTSTAPSATEMRAILKQERIDLLILDIALPGEDGLAICRNLRANSNLPIIMLTARGAALDRIIGLEMGADDYLCKPFEPRELLVRIRNLLRRSERKQEPLNESYKHWRFAGWTLNCVTRQLQNSEGVVVALSAGEFRILNALLKHANRPVSRDQLLNLTRGIEADPFDRSIDLHISRLRKKLTDDPRSPRLIQTLRNEGYMLLVNATK